MSGWLNVVIGLLALALAVLIFIRVRLKKRLDSIDGLVGFAKNTQVTGKVVGGSITRVVRNPKSGSTK